MKESYVSYYKPYINHIDRDNNMGLIRYLLAFGVLIGHFNIICGTDIPWIVSSNNRVGGFFALSGFVLTGSLLKGISFNDFVKKRAWRILPSYFFVVICASILLCFVSSYSFQEYYLDSGFWKYLAANLSFMNWLHPGLPGVFQENEITAVNGSLWTMKVEWQLSLSAPLMIYLCYKYKWNLRKTIIVIISVAMVYRLGFQYMYQKTSDAIYEILGRQFFYQSLFFYCGMLIYTYYNLFIKYRWYLAIVSVVIYITGWLFITSEFYYFVLQPFSITFMVLSLSLLPKDIGSLLDKGQNISYEIFLCHFPVIQLIREFDLIDKFGIASTLTIVITATVALALITYYTVGNLYIRRTTKLVRQTA